MGHASRQPGLEREAPWAGGWCKVWRQVQENHLEEHNCRRDLYTTLMALVQPGSIVTAPGHRQFQARPPPRELPCEQLLRQSTGEFKSFSFDGLVNDGPAPEEEVYRPDEELGPEANEAYQSDEGLVGKTYL